MGGKVGLTDDQIARNEQMKKDLFASEESKAAAMAEFKAVFDEADANKDGVLNFDEFVAMHHKQVANWNEKGGPGGVLSNDDLKVSYDINNKVNPEVEGITIADMLTQWGAYEAAKKAGQV